MQIFYIFSDDKMQFHHTFSDDKIYCYDTFSDETTFHTDINVICLSPIFPIDISKAWPHIPIAPIRANRLPFAV